MNTLNEDYRTTGERLAAALGWPAVDGLHLPAPVADETFRDEFGFLFLADGSVGPFYVSLGGLLRGLWRRHPQPARLRGDASALLTGFASADPVDRALALGAYNALSAALLRQTGFEPPARAGDGGLGALPPGTRVGMVGWFPPLVERLTAQGCRVLVLELSPARVAAGPGAELCRDPAELVRCERVLCTASALVNDSLYGLLDVLGHQVRVELIGPSGSGLPDPLFARGVSAVGGSLFDSREALLGHLRRGEPWGHAARKYQLDAKAYPGMEALLVRLGNGRANPGQA